MKTVYLANVGTNDVQREGKLIPSPRVEGKALLENYENVRGQLQAPILVPGLRRAITEAGSIDRLVLFVTDQPDYVEERYRLRDTLYFGELLKRLLKDMPDIGPYVREILLETIPGNPADHRITLPFYQRVLPRVVSDHVVTVYVAPVGGVDAANEALWITAVRLFSHKVQIIYVTPEGHVEDIPLGDLILGDYTRQRAMAMLSRYDFGGLAAMLADTPRWGTSWLPPFLRALDKRMHFDFDGAIRELEDALRRATGGDRARVNRLLSALRVWNQDIVPPRSGDPPEQWDAWLESQRHGLAELYWNIYIKAQRGEWVDFLGRVFRLTEGLERLVFEDHTRHSTEKFAGDFQDFTTWLEQEEDLLEYLAKHDVHSPIMPNTWVLERIIAYWVQERGLGPQYGRIYKLIQLVRQLSDLRNKSIIAHGWQGVSREDIERETNTDVERFLDTLRVILSNLGIPIEEHALETHVQPVRQMLEKVDIV